MTTAPLDPLVCFALYRASHATSVAYRELLAPWGLTYTQYLVLVLLWNEQTASVRGLGDHLGLDSGTLSPLLKRMEERGLVERRRDGSDERVVTVTLTARGEELRTELEDVPRCVAEATRLSADTAPALLQTLRELTAGMNEVTAGLR
jgi:DNA-binding MarR family transcriptional regulator